MGKHGPCRHCGVTFTPLWRNGPPDKPVLCNACGSRWRTKGSLTNYTPLHAREPIDSEEFKVSKFKSISFKPKEKKLQKIKQTYAAAAEKEREIPYSDQNFRKILEVDTSNRSSSGSATSYSESCTHFGTTEASDITGSAQSHVWESQVPSKRRMGFIRANPKPSPIEELTKDLYTIMQEQESSYFSSSEDLIYESETPMGSFEISTGSVLLRYPNPKVEEESEASSFPIDNKSCIINEAYSGSASKGKSLSAVGTEKLKKSTEQVAQGHVKRDKSYTDKLNLLRDRDSPLSITDLKDVVNFEVLMKHMTDEEQQKLMKYLPSADTDENPGSLRTMFKSSQFVETLSYFQQLLKEGIFDLSISGMFAEERRTLKRLVLQNLSRSAWVDHYKRLKDVKNKRSTEGMEVATGSNYLGCSNFTSLKRARETQNLHAPEAKGTMRSPKRAILHPSSAGTGSRSIIYDTEDFVDNDGTCFSPRTIFADNNRSDHDLLLDVPCNNPTFPDSQLLYHPWGQKQNNTLVESRLVADGEESLSNFPASSFSSQKARNR